MHTFNNYVNILARVLALDYGIKRTGIAASAIDATDIANNIINTEEKVQDYFDKKSTEIKSEIPLIAKRQCA